MPRPKKKKGMSDKLLPLVKFKPQRNSHFALIMTDDIFETSDPVLVFKHFSLNLSLVNLLSKKLFYQTEEKKIQAFKTLSLIPTSQNR